MASTKSPSKVEIGGYFTDGKRLVMVVGFVKADVVVEDCKTGQEMIVTLKRFPRWSPVSLQEID